MTSAPVWSLSVTGYWIRGHLKGDEFGAPTNGYSWNGCVSMCACVYECVITHVMSAIKQNCLTVRAVSQEDCVLEVCVHLRGLRLATIKLWLDTCRPGMG
jgi:hypothetical protein